MPSKEKVQKIFKKDWREDVQLPARFEQHCQGFLKFLREFESTSDEYLECIAVSKHRINLLNDAIKPAHSAPN